MDPSWEGIFFLNYILLKKISTEVLLQSCVALLWLESGQSEAPNNCFWEASPY